MGKYYWWENTHTNASLKCANITERKDIAHVFLHIWPLHISIHPAAVSNVQCLLNVTINILPRKWSTQGQNYLIYRTQCTHSLIGSCYISEAVWRFFLFPQFTFWFGTWCVFGCVHPISRFVFSFTTHDYALMPSKSIRWLLKAVVFLFFRCRNIPKTTYFKTVFLYYTISLI